MPFFRSVSPAVSTVHVSPTPLRPIALSLATGAIIILGVLSTAVTRTNSLFATLVAGCLVLGATATITAIRHTDHYRHRVPHIFSALGAGISLCVGVIMSVSGVIASTKITDFALTALSAAMPVAACALLVGGLSQLSPHHGLLYAGATIGPPLLYWFIISGHSTDCWGAFVLTGIISSGCLGWISIVVSRAKNWSRIRFLGAGAAFCAMIINIATLVINLFANEIPRQTSSIALVAWGLLFCVLCATTSACLVRPHHDAQ
ncbi:hypothetical protein EML15_01570 [Corynebacterium sp. sy017]|uniref:hypothetical protein n=1 Tax=unclassified Corynebacterium TaxID=2624378 RepID=UPI001185BAE3|nr:MULTISPECIES: hypothetical protein [unclassified Corynebacterium]MBP3087844.1 hypothetical protein [Corynebacterium sp. sy017]TSD92387.1 hypothetical protein ELY17_01570 [Corynebacterium sp. SY003]